MMVRAWLLLIALALGQETPEALRLPESEFARRRAAVRETFTDGVIAVDAGPLAEVGSDANTPVFDFKYLTGVHDNDGVLILAGKTTAVFLGEPRKIPGIETVLKADQLESWAAANLKGQTRIYTKLRAKNQAALTAAIADVELVGSKVGPELARLRLIKGESEIRLMRKAADATNAAHLAAMKATKPGMNEREIHELVVATFRKEGCPELGFPPIVGSGKNGTVL